jgi:hypothetical protein
VEVIMTRDEILTALSLNQLTSVAGSLEEDVVAGSHIVSSDGFFGEITAKYVNPYPAPEETPDSILMIMVYDNAEIVPTRKSEMTGFFLIPA